MNSDDVLQIILDNIRELKEKIDNLSEKIDTDRGRIQELEIGARNLKGVLKFMGSVFIASISSVIYLVIKMFTEGVK